MALGTKAVEFRGLDEDELMSKLKDWCKRTNDPALQWPHFK